MRWNDEYLVEKKALKWIEGPVSLLTIPSSSPSASTSSLEHQTMSFQLRWGRTKHNAKQVSQSYMNRWTKCMLLRGWDEKSERWLWSELLKKRRRRSNKCWWVNKRRKNEKLRMMKRRNRARLSWCCSLMWRTTFVL